MRASVDQVLMAQADKHNFGRSVAAEQVATDLFFRKPRTLFWEFLFFGSSSPLRDSFADLRITSKGSTGLFADQIFNLKFPNEKDLSQGLSKAILPAEVRDQSKAAFGALLSYSYIFGFQDLHFSNVVPQSDHLQVIDNEVVLTAMSLPHETLLLPFKKTRFDQAGCTHVFSQWPVTEPADAFETIQGFISLVEHLLSKHDSLNSTFGQVENELSLHPIRVIIRDTLEYKNFLEEGVEPENPFYGFERIQLERKEIPYFFKFLNGKELFAYVDPNGLYEAVNDPRFDLSLTHTIGVHPKSLIASKRLIKHILPFGVLYLAKILIPNSWNGIQEFGRNSLHVDGTKIELRSQTKSFQARR